MWRSEPETIKLEWQKAADRKMLEHMEAHPDYVYRPRRNTGPRKNAAAGHKKTTSTAGTSKNGENPLTPPPTPTTSSQLKSDSKFCTTTIFPSSQPATQLSLPVTPINPPPAPQTMVTTAATETAIDATGLLSPTSPNDQLGFFGDGDFLASASCDISPLYMQLLGMYPFNPASEQEQQQQPMPLYYPPQELPDSGIGMGPQYELLNCFPAIVPIDNVETDNMNRDQTASSNESSTLYPTTQWEYDFTNMLYTDPVLCDGLNQFYDMNTLDPTATDHTNNADFLDGNSFQFA